MLEDEILEFFKNQKPQKVMKDGKSFIRMEEVCWRTKRLLWTELEVIDEQRVIIKEYGWIRKEIKPEEWISYLGHASKTIYWNSGE